jgi:hypothetical protein
MNIDPDEPQVTDLLAQVGFLRADTPPDVTMPDEVWARLQLTTAGADPAVVVPMRRRRPVRAIGGLIAASIAMLALSTAVFIDRDPAPDTVAAASQEAGDLSAIAQVTSSGVNYKAAELRTQVGSLLQSFGMERPEQMRRTGATSASTPSADLVSCLQGLQASLGVQPLIVDRAGYESHASVIVVVSLAFDEAGQPLLDVIVLKEKCDASAQDMIAHVVYSMDS